MLGLALNSKKLKDRLMDSGALISEINMEYARAMNKVGVGEGGVREAPVRCGECN